ncbi:MAG: hypothetical protein PVJ48_02355 [Gammaproteobacteria bacterium]
MRVHMLAVLVIIGLAASFRGAAAEYSHEDHIKEYKGTRTCLKCHREDAESFFHSQHYQWQGVTPGLVNTEDERLGKLSMVNDFCTNPSGSQWIGEVRNEEGKVLAKGCSACHAGLGKIPGQQITKAELENIDCLICHASGYRRDLYPTEDGGWEWRSILWKNQEGLNSIARRISMPTRTMCLRCHSASGGGPNYKRGDIEYTLKDPPRDFDVHMSSEGHNLDCVDCHAGDAHRVRGRGADLAATDSPDNPLSCSGECHSETPHQIAAIDSHTDRVYCTACHIPTFAKDEPTDMRRDWSDIHYSTEKGKYTYRVELEKDVVPVYAWFNGKSFAQLPGTPVRRNDKGEITIVLPDGSRDDPDARIHAFKVHGGRLPVLDDKQWLVPIATEEFYAHGDIDKAIREAAEMFYGLEDIEYSWSDTIRYMGIYHEVTPKEDALQCLDCHRPGGRMDWQALGYERDPLEDRLKASR